MDRDRGGHGAGFANRGLRRAGDRTFSGYGNPWLISVDSRATTGRPGGERAVHLRVDTQPVGDPAERPSSGRQLRPRAAQLASGGAMAGDRGAVERVR